MRSDPLILSFDTSAAHCAAALLQGERVLAQAEEPMARGQAERLLPMLEEVLAQAGVGWRDLAGLGVGVGPGNFTGVRIAIAAARGLALGLGRPAIGVSVFEARAHGLPLPLSVVEEARRGEVYVQRFGLEPEAPVVHALDAAFDVGAVTGSGAAAWVGLAGGRIVAPRYSLAEGIARVASARLGTEQPRPAPLYLRAADAAPSSEAPPVLLP